MTAQGPARKPGGRGSIGAWVKKHPGPSAVIGGAGAIGVYAYLKNRSSSSSAGQSGTSSTDTTGTVATPVNYADDGAGYDSLEQQIASLQNQIAAGSGQAGGSTGTGLPEQGTPIVDKNPTPGTGTPSKPRSPVNNYWTEAKNLLVLGGNKNPSQKQIGAEWRKITPAARQRQVAKSKSKK